jgi:undecaprenyl-diphosphatase
LSDYLLAVALGVIEGLTEFLPVSSTAHLRLFEALVGVDLTDEYWKMFAIVIQLPAVLSLLIYFRGTLAGFLSHFPGGPRGDKTVLTHPATLILVAFVATAGPAFLLKKLIGKNLENVVVMGCALIVGGIVMWIVDVVCSPLERARTKMLEDTSMLQAVWIGLCQVVAPVFPGTSRSMATIAAGQLSGMTRPVALEFSFLLSIPTMIVATGYDLLKSLRPAPGTPAVHIDAHGAVLLVIGGVVSFVVAYAVVAWFMHWVRRHGFTPFAIYRIVAGALVLVFAKSIAA